VGGGGSYSTFQHFGFGKAKVSLLLQATSLSVWAAACGAEGMKPKHRVAITQSFPQRTDNIKKNKTKKHASNAKVMENDSR